MDLSPIPRWQRVVGWVLTALPAAALLNTALTIFVMRPPEFTEGFQKMGFPESVGPVVGACALVSAVLYLVPQTAVLGTILITGYMGGAIVTHLRVADGPMFLPATILGVIAWLGLYLRDRRVRALLPLRS